MDTLAILDASFKKRTRWMSSFVWRYDGISISR